MFSVQIFCHWRDHVVCRMAELDRRRLSLEKQRLAQGLGPFLREQAFMLLRQSSRPQESTWSSLQELIFAEIHASGNPGLDRCGAKAAWCLSASYIMFLYKYTIHSSFVYIMWWSTVSQCCTGWLLDCHWFPDRFTGFGNSWHERDWETISFCRWFQKDPCKWSWCSLPCLLLQYVFSLNVCLNKWWWLCEICFDPRLESYLFNRKVTSNSTCL